MRYILMLLLSLLDVANFCYANEVVASSTSLGMFVDTTVTTNDRLFCKL